VIYHGDARLPLRHSASLLDPRRRIGRVGIDRGGVGRLPERREARGELRGEGRLVDDDAEIAAPGEVVLLPVAGAEPGALAVDDEGLGVGDARERDEAAGPQRDRGEPDRDVGDARQLLQAGDGPGALGPVGEEQLDVDAAPGGAQDGRLECVPRGAVGVGAVAEGLDGDAGGGAVE